MNIQFRSAQGVRLSALFLTAVVAGCGSANVTTSSGQGLPTTTADAQKTDAIKPLKAPPACNAVSIGYKFNGTAIPAGSWIWFSSVFHSLDNVVRFHMADSHIALREGSTNYNLKTPGARISLHNRSNLHINWAPHHNIWWLMAPIDTAGNDFLNGFAWQVPSPGLAGGETVTWSAKFYSKRPAQMQWQWAAAVYSQFDNFPTNYNSLAVKPLDDNHYVPYNSDHAGTPENDKSYLQAGAGGGGGSNYTGGLSSTLALTPCQR